MTENRLAHAPSASGLPHIHSLDFTIIAGKNFDAAAGYRFGVHSRDKEGDLFPQELLNRERVTALRRIRMPPQLFIQLTQQLESVGGVGTFFCDYREHS